MLIRRVGWPVRRSAARVHVVHVSNLPMMPDPATRRQQALRRNAVMSGVLAATWMATVITVVLILGFIVVRGTPGLTVDFFTRLPAPPGVSGGGLAHALAGSARLVALAAIVAVPIALLGAIALAEHAASRWSALVRFVGELLGGVPSIIVGILGYSIIVCATEPPHFSAWAGSFALAVLMLPIVLRASEEALRVVPAEMRQASYALGAGHFRTTVAVVLPAALPGISTGIVLAVARIAGETAPLLLTAYGSSFFARSFDDPTPFLSKYIYNYATSGFTAQEQQAWTAALVLLTFIVVISVGIRLFTARTTGGDPARD
jgi:phosphate transport system permease protein